MTLCRSSQAPITGRTSWPKAKGSSNCSAMSPSALMLNPAPCALSITATSAGVSTIPTRLDTEALQRAADTLPRAMEVKAMEDCTVEGSTQTNISPIDNSGVSQGRSNVVSSRPIAGNRMKVLAKTRDCSRQCEIPSSTAWGDSRAP